MDEQQIPEITPIPVKALTVMDIVSELRKSQGFLVFAAFIVKNEETMESNLEFRYIRQQYSSDDIPSAFKEVKVMMANDLKKSGNDVLRAAEQIIASEDLKGNSDILP